MKQDEAMALGAAVYVHSPYSDFITFTVVEVLLLGLSGIHTLYGGVHTWI